MQGSPIILQANCVCARARCTRKPISYPWEVQAPLLSPSHHAAVGWMKLAEGQPKGPRGRVFVASSRIPSLWAWCLGTLKKNLEVLENKSIRNPLCELNFSSEVWVKSVSYIKFCVPSFSVLLLFWCCLAGYHAHFWGLSKGCIRKQWSCCPIWDIFLCAWVWRSKTQHNFWRRQVLHEVLSLTKVLGCC